jgi:hypothetical protein
MKKLLILLISILMIASLSVPAFAVSDDLSDLTDVIISTVNDLLDDSLSRAVTTSDLDYDKAFKIYIGVDVFKLDTNNIHEIEAALSGGKYIYEVPLYIDGGTVIVNLSKGLPLKEDTNLPEEAQQKILANVGKWQVTGVKHSPRTIDYFNDVSQEVGEVPDGTILVGSLPYFRYAVALLPDESGEVQGLVPLSRIPSEEEISAFRINSDQKVYDYSQIKAYVNQLPTPNPDEAGGYGSQDVSSPDGISVSYMLVIGVLAAAVVGIAVIVYRKKPRATN